MARNAQTGPEGFSLFNDFHNSAIDARGIAEMVEHMATVPRPVPAADPAARPPILPSFHRFRKNCNIVDEYRDKSDARGDLLKAHQLHTIDLEKTQATAKANNTPSDQACVLVLVKYPEYASEFQLRSCRYSRFETGTLRLTMDQVLNTGSEILKQRLNSETHQRRAKKAAAPLPEGVTHVLDLSPTTDEDDLSLALQYLHVSRGVKLWYRSVAIGVQPLAVSGHDDVCDCLLPSNEPYPYPSPRLDESSCPYECEDEWPIEEHRNIPDFCPTRWAASTIRLFRHISQPPGHKDILINSAPRLWTLVGLFRKLGMTNCDILRDEVTAWFNADRNHLFLEMLPEETIQIGLALHIPCLTEPAFRILVSERALEVAAGLPRAQPSQTIFGRRSFGFSAADDAESISRMIENAGTAMADRYRAAIDMLCKENILDEFAVPAWQQLRALDKLIPQSTEGLRFSALRASYDRLMSALSKEMDESIGEVVLWPSLKKHKYEGNPFPGYVGTYMGRRSWRHDEIDELRAFSVPGNDLRRKQAFEKVYARLNLHQRALCPFIWQHLLLMDPFKFPHMLEDSDLAIAFNRELETALQRGLLQQHATMGEDANINLLEEYVRATTLDPRPLGPLIESLRKTLYNFIEPLLESDQSLFQHTMTPYLLLTATDLEMNMVRFLGDESRFQPDIPETDFGANGPGPGFHTGRSVLSVSDLDPDFEHLAVDSTHEDDDTSTVVGSVVAQDGLSTVYNRRRVIAQSSDLASESEAFTDVDMDLEFRDAIEHHNRQYDESHQMEIDEASHVTVDKEKEKVQEGEAEDFDSDSLPDEFYDSESNTDDFEFIFLSA